MPILDAGTVEFISRNPEQTRRIGARLGALLTGGEIIALEGDLGAGKTVLAQGIGMGWGATTRLISPTFVIVRRHDCPQGGVYLYHIDLYRLESELEIEGLGLYDMLGEDWAICMIEWPERATFLFEDAYLWISLHWLDDHRRSLICRAEGARHEALLEQFRKEVIGR